MEITISNSTQEPIYEQIARQTKKMIINGELNPGEMLPSIRALAKDLKISVITTKRAYEELEKESYIETVGGKGSFVAVYNQDFIREKRVKLLEEKMSEIITDSRTLNIGLQGLKMMLEVLYREV